VLYLTCSEMAAYFEKNEVSYSSFWKQPTGGKFAYDEKFIAKTTNTFRKASSEHHGASVAVEFSKQLVHDYQVRVFNVREIYPAVHRTLRDNAAQHR